MVCSAISFSSLVGAMPNRSLQELHQGCADFLLQFDDVAEALVLGSVCIEFCEQGDRALLALSPADRP